MGSTNDQFRDVFYDKIITFVNAGGLPHSYMAWLSMANSMMLDFKCIINPYNVYVHSRHWNDGVLVSDAMSRLRKSMHVMSNLSKLLKDRDYKSNWEI